MGRKANRTDKVIQPVIFQGSKIQLFADFFQHFPIVFAVRVRIVFQKPFGHMVAFPFPDNPAGN